MGDFGEKFAQGLDAVRFSEAVHGELRAAETGGFLIFILEAPTSRGPAPVGLITAEADGNRLTPHVDWFQWASSRNKVETILQFLNETRRTWQVLIMSSPDNKGFFEVMVKYAVLRKAGTLLGWGDDGSTTSLFQTIRPEVP